MRIPAIDTFKGLAILMVVFIHTKPFLIPREIRADWYIPGQSILLLCSFGVPFFFVAAGYFFSHGLNRQTIGKRWWKYISRLLVLLACWTVIDGIFWTEWLQQILDRKSLAPLLWNLVAIPSFAMTHPVLFWSRGTATPLWFLFSLIAAITLLTLAIRYRLDRRFLVLLATMSYLLGLGYSSYVGTPIGFTEALPISLRGPLIAFAFVSLGHYVAIKQSHKVIGAALLGGGVLLVFGEAILLSYVLNVPFREQQYLLFTPVLALGGLIFALQHPDFGNGSWLQKIGTRSLGIYLVHVPLLEAFIMIRKSFISPAWEIMYPLLVLATSYLLVITVARLPYLRTLVR